MPHALVKGETVPIRLWAPLGEVDSAVLRQLKNVARLPWVVHHVAVMPDVHAARGATVGSVIAMRDAVAPAAVGVDIGCGMAAVETNLSASDLPDNLRALRDAIEEAIPVARGAHREPVWPELSEEIREQGRDLMERFKTLTPLRNGLERKAACQIGSLGGGNHFIELCLDTRDKVWMMLHSGSRNAGALLAEHHIAVAQRLSHNQTLPDPDLAVFLSRTPAFEAYRRDLYWAQEYAAFNRRVMLSLLAHTLLGFFPHLECEAAISCHHNYVAEEVHFGEQVLVTRKGAIRAGTGDLGIIPGSMGAKSYIVRGKGNPLSFESASHGAGRRLTRNQARRSFTLADLQRQTEGVECRKDRGILDEAPKAYKNIDRVMAQQEDLVEIVAELKQVLCVKG